MPAIPTLRLLACLLDARPTIVFARSRIATYMLQPRGCAVRQEQYSRGLIDS